MSDELDRLQDLQDDIHAAHGVWGARRARGGLRRGGGRADLRWRRRRAAPDRGVLRDRRAVGGAGAGRGRPAAQDGISEVWTGDTHVSANEALRALADDMFRALTAFRAIGGQVRQHAEQVQHEPGDRANAAGLAEIATTVGAMTWGAVPNLEYEGQVMRDSTRGRSRTIDGRVGTHIAMRHAAEDFATALHEIETQARTGRLSDSPLSAVDEVVIAGAGWTRTMVPHPPVLTPAMDQRAAEALAAMSDDDRERMTGLLAAAASPEHRAYLLKTLAAGIRCRRWPGSTS